MTDKEVYEKILNGWDSSKSWTYHISYISTIDLIKFARIAKRDDMLFRIDVMELKSRTDIPEELKLEVLLMIGDYVD